MTILDALGVLTRKAEPKSAHSVFIESQLLPIVVKVQKEIGWRRYKVCVAEWIVSCRESVVLVS
jgi:hypothetical protein